MNKYYCHVCALVHRLYPPLEPDPLNLIRSEYQLEKFLKHTIPADLPGVVSFFTDPNYTQYEYYTVNTSVSGSVEVDVRGRTNIVWYAGRDMGIKYESGHFITTCDTVKVVLHNNLLRIHSFPEDSFVYEKKKCEVCGRDILW